MSLCWLLLGGFALSSLGLFFFSGMETALSRMDREGRNGGGAEPAGAAGAFEAELLDHPLRFIGVALFGSAVCFAGAVVTAIGLGGELLPGGALGSLVLTVLVTLPVLYLVGEAVPRTLFGRHPRELLRLLRRPARLVFMPLRWLSSTSMWPYVSPMEWRWMPAGSLLSLRAVRDELREMLAGARESGLLAGAGRKMLGRVVEARSQAVTQIMQPLERIVSCPETVTRKSLVETILQNGITRIPIWRDGPDRVIGIVHATDLLGQDVTRGPLPPDLVRQPLRVPPETSSLEMLRLFQRSRSHMGIVESPPGRAVGLLTIEDVLESMIGEIRDEHDPAEPGIRQLFQDTFLVDAVLSVESVNRRLGLKLPTGKYDTLSGFVLSLFRRIPAVGDEKSHGDVLFFVTKADAKRVEQVILKRLRPQ